MQLSGASPSPAPPAVAVVAPTQSQRLLTYVRLLRNSIPEVFNKHDAVWLADGSNDDAHRFFVATTRTIEGMLAGPKDEVHRQLSTSAQLMSAKHKIAASPDRVRIPVDRLPELRKRARAKCVSCSPSISWLTIPVVYDRHDSIPTRKAICARKALVYEASHEAEVAKKRRRDDKTSEDEEVLPLLQRLLPEVTSVTNNTLKEYLLKWNEMNPLRRKPTTGARAALLAGVRATNE